MFELAWDNMQQSETIKPAFKMAAPKDEDSTPVRERAREQLRACQMLIRDLFEAHWQLLNRK